MNLFKNFKAARTRLTHVGENEPLNFLSIVVIIALDIFVLWNVFQGVAFQTSQLTRADEAVPYDCQNLAGLNERPDDADWDRINFIVSRDYDFGGNTYSWRGYKKGEALIEPCAELYLAANALMKAPESKTSQNRIDNLNRDISSARSSIRQYERDYDTQLLETIAGQGAANSITEGTAQTAKQNIEAQQSLIAQKEREITGLQNTVVQSALAQDYLALRSTSYDIVDATYKDLQFWYPVKKLVFRLIFLLPLLFVFTMLYRHSVKRNKPLLTLIFSHLLVVACIPIIIEVMQFFFELLPFHLLADLLSLLESWNLVVLWNYFLILFGIGAALGLIYFAQKKLFARERIMQKRIAKQECCACGTKLKGDPKHCFKCGVANLKNCKHCNGLTFVEGANCRECGKSDF